MRLIDELIAIKKEKLENRKLEAKKVADKMLAELPDIIRTRAREGETHYITTLSNFGYVLSYTQADEEVVEEHILKHLRQELGLRITKYADNYDHIDFWW